MVGMVCAASPRTPYPRCFVFLRCKSWPCTYGQHSTQHMLLDENTVLARLQALWDKRAKETIDFCTAKYILNHKLISKTLHTYPCWFLAHIPIATPSTSEKACVHLIHSFLATLGVTQPERLVRRCTSNLAKNLTHILWEGHYEKPITHR